MYLIINLQLHKTPYINLPASIQSLFSYVRGYHYANLKGKITTVADVCQYRNELGALGLGLDRLNSLYETESRDDSMADNA